MATNDNKDATRSVKAEYDALVKEFAGAIELLQKADYAGARKILASVEATKLDEPELKERARTYTRVCDQRLAPPAEAPSSEDDRYHRAVMLSNEGRWDESVRLLDDALQQNPMSVRHLYVRASAWALQGSADRAVTDLRQAIAIDSTVRFQAINDPDFERIREEPSFIDIIEPTPAGA